MSTLVWLAAYPKSGNTWLRVLLSQLLVDTEQAVDINRLPIHWGIDRPTFDRLSGLESSGLTDAEIERRLPRVYRSLARERNEPLYLKTHGACVPTPSGEPRFPPQASRAVIYSVRNPLDVCVSYAHHSGWTMEQTLATMNDPDHRIGPGGWLPLPPEPVGRWSDHVTGWLAHPAPVLVLRYEHLLDQPLATVERLVRFLDLDRDPERIQQAVEYNDFTRLQQQETEAGFREKARNMKRFFRHGTAGQWREALSRDQIERLIAEHGAVMRRLGYEPSIR